MSRNSLHIAAVLGLCCHLGTAIAAEPEKQGTRTAQEDRACAGVTNESTKMRELRREMGAYFGQTVPDELQQRVRRHIEQVAKLKVECDQQRDPSALATSKQ